MLPTLTLLRFVLTYPGLSLPNINSDILVALETSTVPAYLLLKSPKLNIVSAPYTIVSVSLNVISGALIVVGVFAVVLVYSSYEPYLTPIYWLVNGVITKSAFGSTPLQELGVYNLNVA